MGIFVQYEKDGVIHKIDCQGFSVIILIEHGIEVRYMKLKPLKGQSLEREYIPRRYLVGAGKINVHN